MTTEMETTCRLCQAKRPLMLSHILPAFAFRWLKETSGGSHLRSTEEPNRRIQDGLQLPWLCEACEQLFSKEEREFANRIFYPYLEDSAAKLPYGPSLLRFCTSISWRVLSLALEHDAFDVTWPPESIQRCRKAELAWREFLLGRRPHPGEFRQHLWPLELIDSGADDAEPNINRLLTRTLQMDLCHGNGLSFTFAKLGKFAIFGMIQHDPQGWQGTRVQANQGMIMPRKYVIPAEIWVYLNRKARDVTASIGKISTKQREKIDLHFQQNIGRFIGSDAFRATQADVEMFGDAAFSESASQP